MAYLIFEGGGTDVTERQLETAVAALEADLEGDEDVGAGLGGGSHDDEIGTLLGIAQEDVSGWHEREW